MSWRTRFRVRQYVKGSLWLAPLAAGLGGFVLAELWAGNEQYVLRASADATSNTIHIRADAPNRWEI